MSACQCGAQYTAWWQLKPQVQRVVESFDGQFAFRGDCDAVRSVFATQAPPDGARWDSMEFCQECKDAAAVAPP